MPDSWLITPDELNIPESKDNQIATMQITIDYLMGKSESSDEKRRVAKEYIKSQGEKRKQLKPSTGFTKVHKLINQRAVIEHMFKAGEERMLFKLIPFCNLESNFICDEDGLPMNQKAIIKLTGMSKSDVIEIMESLIGYGVIYKFISGKSVFYKFSKDWIGS